jgi:hypothetical protein
MAVCLFQFCLKGRTTWAFSKLFNRAFLGYGIDNGDCKANLTVD